jgi:hypothetical protein
MKNKIVIFLTVLFISTVPFNMVHAQDDSTIYLTQSGVSIENNIYQKLCDIYSKNYIETINQEEYELIVSNDLESVDINEYYDSGVVTRGSYFESNAKVIRIVKNGNYITLMASWKGVPKIKSYDVIAVRLNNVSLSGGYTFKQTTVLNEKLNVSYDSYKQSFSNGFGSSFKVQDGTSLEISLTFMISGTGTVYGSYQHASTKATLAESKKYTISHLGYGKVINFDSSVKNKYDAMTGVDISF